MEGTRSLSNQVNIFYMISLLEFIIFYVICSKRTNRKRKRDTAEENSDNEMLVEKQYEESTAEVEPKRTKHLLPIKTRDGLVQRTVDTEIDGIFVQNKTKYTVLYIIICLGRVNFHFQMIKNLHLCGFAV